MKINRVLFDSDVLIDFLSNRIPYAEHIEKILLKCCDNLFQGFITPVIISNIYYIMRKNEKHEKVIDKLKLLIEIIDVINIDKEVIIKSFNSKFSDFEDALQNYSAELNQIDIIVTRYFKDYKNSNLVILTPLELISYL